MELHWDDKVLVNVERLKEVRNEMGIGLTRLADKISALQESGHISVSVSKSTLQRIETIPDAPIKFQIVQAIAMALGFDPEVFTLTAPQKVRILECVKLEKGADVIEAIRSCDEIRLILDVEPAEPEAQNDIVTLVRYLEDRGRSGSLSDEVLLQFGVRRALETLKSHGLHVYFMDNYQVAPIEFHDEWGSDISWHLVESVSHREKLKRGRDFDGLGLCKVLFVIISDWDERSFEFEHDMDPAEYVSEDCDDRFLLENLARLSAGETFIEFHDLTSLNLDEFISPKARELEIAQRRKKVGMEF